MIRHSFSSTTLHSSLFIQLLRISYLQCPPTQLVHNMFFLKINVLYYLFILFWLLLLMFILYLQHYGVKFFLWYINPIIMLTDEMISLSAKHRSIDSNGVIFMAVIIGGLYLSNCIFSIAKLMLTFLTSI